MTTKQAKPTARGGNRNPTGKGGFQERPQDRSDGRWKAEDSISFQYNKLMRMSPEQLIEFKPETVAQDIAKSRIQAARDKKFGLADTKEISDRTEGKAPQSIDVTSGGEKIKSALVEFVGTDTKDGVNDKS